MTSRSFSPVRKFKDVRDGLVLDLQADNLNSDVFTDFNGVSDFIDFGADSDLNVGADDFTILIKLKAVDDGALQMLFGKYSGASYANSAGGHGYELLYRGDQAHKELYFRVNNGAGSGDTCNTGGEDYNDIGDGEEHTISIRVNRALARVYIEVDGVDATVSGYEGIAGQAGTYTNTGKYILGRQSGTADGGFMTGSVKLFRQYNKLLTAEEAEQVFSGDFTDETDLVLDHEASDIEEIDSDNKAELINVPLIEFGSLKALYFDGVNAIAKIADDSKFGVPATGELTVSCWIRPDVLDFPNSKASGEGPYVHFLQKGEYDPVNHEWTFRMYNKTASDRPNRVSFYLYNQAGGIGVGSYFQDTEIAGKWIHVLAKVDDQFTYIYKNGIFRDKDDYTIDPIITPENTPARIGIGAPPSQDSDDCWFKGAISLVRIWNKCLSDDEIRRAYEFEKRLFGIL